MLLYWLWRELWTGLSPQEFARLRSSLERAGIRYDFRTEEQSATDRARRRPGPFSTDSSLQYYVFVRKKDYDRAQACLANLTRTHANQPHLNRTRSKRKGR